MRSFLKPIFGARKAAPPGADEPAGFRCLPPPADAAAYRAELTRVLSEHSAHAQRQIRSALHDLPPKLHELHFGIHPDQDCEGTFSVMMHAEGPDLYVLNKALGDYRLLFEIKRVEGGLNVAVPLFDPDEVEYPVNDIIANMAASWIEEQWDVVGSEHPELPVMIFCADDWGSDLPRRIQGRSR